MGGKIDFALLKGHFNQNQFEYKLISNETFIGITLCIEAVKKELSQGYLKEIPKKISILAILLICLFKNSPDKSHIEYWFEK